MSDEGGGFWDETEEEENQPDAKVEEKPSKQGTISLRESEVGDDDEGSKDENESVKSEKKSRPRKELPPVAAEKSEAMLIIEAKQRKHEEEENEALRVIEEGRRLQREKEDEELRRLKEKQAQRKKEREEEERKLEEQKALIEEQRRKEEEARRQKTEDDKRRKQEEAERKKAAAQAAMSGGRNFVIEKEREGQSTMDKFMNISKAKTEMSLNTGELEALKQRTMTDRIKPLALDDDLDSAALKAKAEELWKSIILLETAKYDLVERLKRQEYDLKELNERQRQMNVKKHVAQGLDADAAHSRYPPKVQLISKYERRTDRRTFGERKSLFEIDQIKAEQKELIKPKGKVRADWVKGKKTADTQDEDENAEDTADTNGNDMGMGKIEETQEEPVNEAEPAAEEEQAQDESPENVMEEDPVAAVEVPVGEEECDSLW